MNFSERFKGKTSIMTKEGLSELVRSSKVPVHKRSSSPELAPIEESRNTLYLADVIITKALSRLLLHF